MSNCLQCFSTVLIPCNSILNIWEFHIFQLLIEAKVRKDEKEIKWYSSACLEQVDQRSNGCPTPTGDICSCDALTFCLPAHFWNNTTVSEKFSVFCQKITEIRKQTLQSTKQIFSVSFKSIQNLSYYFLWNRTLVAPWRHGCSSLLLKFTIINIYNGQKYSFFSGSIMKHTAIVCESKKWWLSSVLWQKRKQEKGSPWVFM